MSESSGGMEPHEIIESVLHRDTSDLDIARRIAELLGRDMRGGQVIARCLGDNSVYQLTFDPTNNWNDWHSACDEAGVGQFTFIDLPGIKRWNVLLYVNRVCYSAVDKDGLRAANLALLQLLEARESTEL